MKANIIQLIAHGQEAEEVWFDIKIDDRSYAEWLMVSFIKSTELDNLIRMFQLFGDKDEALEVRIEADKRLNFACVLDGRLYNTHEILDVLEADKNLGFKVQRDGDKLGVFLSVDMEEATIVTKYKMIC